MIPPLDGLTHTREQAEVYAGLRMSLGYEQRGDRDWSDTAILLARDVVKLLDALAGRETPAPTPSRHTLAANIWNAAVEYLADVAEGGGLDPPSVAALTPRDEDR